jgi:1-acyl-sn-glycerol-3-phosphate acyltransferase
MFSPTPATVKPAAPRKTLERGLTVFEFAHAQLFSARSSRWSTARLIYVVRYALIVLYTVIWGGLGFSIGLLDRSGESVVWMAKRWVSWILGTCHIEVDCDGLESLDPEQPYVLMSNHQSVFDTAAIIATLPLSFRFVAKRELTWIPFFGWALRAGGHVIIDRSRRERAVHSLRQAAQRIQRGTNVIIFPEGTRSTTETLGEFKSGGFHLAIQAGVPVVPISVSGSRSITPKKSLRIESGHIHVHYGTPIPTKGLTVDDRGALKSAVRAAILGGLDPELQAPPRAGA